MESFFDIENFIIPPQKAATMAQIITIYAFAMLVTWEKYAKYLARDKSVAAWISKIMFSIIILFIGLSIIASIKSFLLDENIEGFEAWMVYFAIPCSVGMTFLIVIPMFFSEKFVAMFEELEGKKSKEIPAEKPAQTIENQKDKEEKENADLENFNP